MSSLFKWVALVWFLALAFLCVTSMAHCQETHPFISGAVSILDNLGYSNPSGEFGTGVDVTLPHSWLTARVAVGAKHKIETGNGRGYSAEIAPYFRAHGFLYGFGAKWSQEKTSQWSKSAVRPFAAFGHLSNRHIIQARYILPLGDVQNGLQGGELHTELMTARHFSFEMTWGLYAFHDTRVPGVDYGNIPAEYHYGASTGLGVKYAF